MIFFELNKTILSLTLYNILYIFINKCYFLEFLKNTNVRVIQQAWFDFKVFHFLFSLYWFWGYTQLCSRLTVGSVPRNNSLQDFGWRYLVYRNKPRSRVIQNKCAITILYFQSILILIVFTLYDYLCFHIIQSQNYLLRILCCLTLCIVSWLLYYNILS